jgi:integrase/recombinase XerD
MHAIKQSAVPEGKDRRKVFCIKVDFDCRSKCAWAKLYHERMSGVPVEYGVAVERFLADAALAAASRRVYRISLIGWAWPLVGLEPPAGVERRGARAPIVPLALLDDDGVGERLADAVADRARHVDVRTVNRELSALRSAVGWWQELGWIRCDPTAGLRLLPRAGEAAGPLTDRQLAELFNADVTLRERALWQLLHDTGMPAPVALSLDASDVARAGQVSERTSSLLAWLLSGRPIGPIFLTDRKAPSGTAKADLCPLTGRARMSYRRAAEIFTAVTRPFDPAGRGWTLHQLRPVTTG